MPAPRASQRSGTRQGKINKDVSKDNYFIDEMVFVQNLFVDLLFFTFVLEMFLFKNHSILCDFFCKSRSTFA